MMSAFDDLIPAKGGQTTSASRRSQAQGGAFDDLIPQRSGAQNLVRQLGLTARYGLEGVGNVVGIGSEPIRSLLSMGGLQTPSAAATFSGLADRLGLPSPETGQERVVGDVARTMASAGGTLGAASLAARGGTGLAQQAGQLFAQQPAQQLAAAAGSGAAGGSAREAGWSPAGQFIAALGGGITGPALVNAGRGTAEAVRRAAAPRQAPSLDLRIESTLADYGIDWNALGAGVKAQMRRDVGNALMRGENLDDLAMMRLASFRQLRGVTPTRAVLTRDAVDFTREKNLAKVGANSSDATLQQLAQLENANNRALIQNLADISPPVDRYAGGSRVIQGLQQRVNAANATRNRLYETARASAGRDVPLDGAAFSQRVNAALDERMLGSALPQSVIDRINQISTGQFPLTVSTAEQLKSRLGEMTAKSEGSARMALRVVREALDDAPLRVDRPIPNTPSGAPGLPGPAPLGEQAISAFNRARRFNRAFERTSEASPALAAVRDGAEPDRFIQQYITGNQSTAADWRRLATSLRGDPGAREAVRGSVIEHLRSKALGGAADDVGRFDHGRFNQALNAIGAAKLRSFFDPQEIEQLQAVGRVASYLQAQPVGAAVNNSNTAAMAGGALTGILSNPLLSPVRFPLQSITARLGGAQALNVPPALLQAPVRQAPAGLLAAPAATMSLLGAPLLLAPPVVPER